MGVNGPAPGADSFEAILEVYDDWVTKIVPRKIIAHLTSYRSVDPLPPVPSLAPVLAPYAEVRNADAGSARPRLMASFLISK